MISLITPALDEEANIGALVERAVSALEPLDAEFEIILVDDGSRDATFAIMEDLARADPRVVAVSLRRNFGQTAALAAGLEVARGDILVTMDADLQNDPADIPMMLERIAAGADMVLGYRERRQDRFLTRRLPSVIANRLLSWVTGVRIRDTGCALKVFRAGILRRIPLYSDMHRFLLPLAVPLGARIDQVAVRHHPRRAGQSKYGLWRTPKVVLDLMVLAVILRFDRRPLTVFLQPALLLALAAALFALAGARGPETAAPGTFANSAFLLAATSLWLLILGGAAAMIGKRSAMMRGTGPHG